MQSVLVGTSGYGYKDWVGPVYPPGTAAKDYLAWYARRFSFTELNFSYYTQPREVTCARMAAVTPDRFRFAIKAHRSLTHEVGDDIQFRDQAAEFRRGIAPLVESAKLAAVLFQFPYGFHYTARSRRHLQRICTTFAGLPLAVEFRNAQWERDSVCAGLRQYRAARVNVDEPSLPGLLAPSACVTADMAYIRFHGRNRENWWTGDNVSRYDYLYTADELADWIPRITDMAHRASTVIIAFNNHQRGQAVHNADMLLEQLAAA